MRFLQNVHFSTVPGVWGGASNSPTLNLKIILRVVANQTANTLVGTSLDARLTPNAQISIDEHDTVFSLLVAPVGHALRQAGSAQCWHCIGRKFSVQLGKVPPALSLARAPRDTAVPMLSKSSSPLVYTTLYVAPSAIVRHFARRAHAWLQGNDEGRSASVLSHLLSLPRVLKAQRSRNRTGFCKPGCSR